MVSIHETGNPVNEVNFSHPRLKQDEPVFDSGRVGWTARSSLSLEEFNSLSSLLKQREREVDQLERRVAEVIQNRVHEANVNRSFVNAVDFDDCVDELRKEVFSKDAQILELKRMISQVSKADTPPIFHREESCAQTIYPIHVIDSVVSRLDAEIEFRRNQESPILVCKSTQVSITVQKRMPAKKGIHTAVQSVLCGQAGQSGQTVQSVSIQTSVPIIEGAALARTLQDQLYRVQDELHTVQRELQLTKQSPTSDKSSIKYRNRVFELEIDNAILAARLDRTHIVLPLSSSVKKDKLFAEMDTLINALKGENIALKRGKQKTPNISLSTIGIQTRDTESQLQEENAKLKKDLAALDDDRFWSDLDQLQRQHSECISLLARVNRSSCLPAELSREITCILNK